MKNIRRSIATAAAIAAFGAIAPAQASANSSCGGASWYAL
ncbi:MAG: septal ring lytic transglycosylase RlpA family lipoprotein, partial [Rhizobiaceae bacterium]|nr:septal ring lytic transglycosylase RlpA family lipoprotein [Rhizobiaceae bacterium]